MIGFNKSFIIFIFIYLFTDKEFVFGVQVKKIIKQQIQGSCDAHTTQTAGFPYHQSYANLGGDSFFQGYQEITSHFWMKIDDEISDFDRNIWFFQQGTTSDQLKHIFSISYNSFKNNIFVRHNQGSDILENDFINSENIIQKGKWVYITVSISEITDQIYLAGYFPDYTETTPGIYQYYEEKLYTSPLPVNDIGFGFSDLNFYAATKQSGFVTSEFQTLCGSLQNMDLVMGYFTDSAYSNPYYLNKGFFGSNYLGNTQLLNLQFNIINNQTEKQVSDSSLYQNRIQQISSQQLIQEDGSLQLKDGEYLQIIDNFVFQQPYFVDTDFQGVNKQIDSVSFIITYLVNFETETQPTIIERIDDANNIVMKISHPFVSNKYQLKIQFYVLDINDNKISQSKQFFTNINPLEWHRITLMFYNNQFSNQSDVPFYNFYITGILNNNVVINHQPLIENSEFKNSFLLQRYDDITRINQQQRENIEYQNNFYLRDLQVFSGTQILLNTDISTEISNCYFGVIIEDQIQCIQCDTNYILDNNVCSLSCPGSDFNQINQPDLCINKNKCHYKCNSCNPEDLNTCISCSGYKRILSQNCECDTGYYDVFDQKDCQKYVQSQNYTIGTFTMSVNSVTLVNDAEELNQTKNNSTYTQEVLFDNPFYLLPKYLGLSVVQWQKTDNTILEYDIDYIPESLSRVGFTAILELYNNTKLESITFQYICSDDFYSFRAGRAKYTYYSLNFNADDGDPLTDEEIYIDLAQVHDSSVKYKQVLVQNVPWSSKVPYKVMTYLQSFRDIDISKKTGYKCEVTNPSTAGSQINFKIKLTSLIGARTRQMVCGYVIVPKYMVSDDIEKSFSSQDYVNSQDPSPIKSYATTQFNGNYNDIPMITKQFYSSIFYLSFENQELVTGQKIEFGYKTELRTQSDQLQFQVIQDNSVLNHLKLNILVPIQNCDYACESCYFGVQGTTCKICNPNLDPLNRDLQSPNCGCIKDYYEDISTRQCNECTNAKCDQCYENVDQCLFCKENRVKIPGIRDTSGPPFCDCLEGEREFLDFGSPFCGNCTFSQPVMVELSKDYTEIKIMFNFEIDIMLYVGTLNSITKMREPMTSTCEYLFKDEFIQKLGVQPTCYLGKDNDDNQDYAIIISIGGQPLIFPDELIIFNPNTLRDRNLPLCQVPAGQTRSDSFDQVLELPIIYSVIPEPLPDPIIELSVPQNPVTICPELKIQVNKVTNDLNFGVKKFAWKFLSIEPQDDELLESLNELAIQFNDKKYLEIPQVFLNPDSDYTFELNFRTYMGTENTQQFTFSTSGTEGLITYIEQQNFDLYIWEDVTLVAQYLHFKCETGNVQTLLSPVTVEWQTMSGNDIGIEKIEERESGLTYTQEKIEPFVAEVSTENLIKVTITLESGKTAFTTQKLRFLVSDIVVKLKGGSRIHAYQKILEMRSEIKDPDVNPEISSQSENITVQWECKKMENLDEDCVDYTQENFLIDTNQLENQHSFDIQPRRMEPYKVYQFKIYGQKPEKESKQDIVIIIAQELDLPALTVAFPTELLQKNVNLNEEIFTTIEYSLEDEYDQSILQYSATVLYEFEARDTKIFDFKKTRLKIWDHFVDFKRSELIQLRYTVYNPYFMMPSTSMVNVKVNTPAYNCTVSLEGGDFKSLESQITVETRYCIDQDQPLQYKYFLYQSDEEYEQERVQPIFQKRLILTDFIQNNKFSTFLPQSKYQDQQQILVVSVIDSAGGIKNITNYLKMEPFTTTNLNLYLQKIEEIFQESKNLDLNDQIRYLSVLSEDIANNELIQGLESQQFIDFKQSLLEDLDIIKNSLLPSSELDAQIAKAIEILNSDSSFLQNQTEDQILKKVKDQEQFLSIKQEQGSIIKLETRSIKQTMTAEKIESIAQSQLQVYDSFIKGANSQNPEVQNLEIPYIQSSKENLNEKIFNLTDQASEVSLQNMLPNQESKYYQGKSFKIKSQKITNKNINQFLGVQPSWDKNRLNQEIEDVIDGNQEYFVGFKEFDINPYASSDQFYYNQTGIPIKDPSIKKAGESVKMKINSPITHDFDIPDQEDNQSDNLVCISKDDENNWDKENCQSKIYEDEDGQKKVKCICNDLSVATVINDTDQIFSNSYIEEVFSNQGFNMLANFKFWEDPVFYILMFFSVVIVASIIYGYKLDKIAQKELQAIQPDIQEGQELDEVKDCQEKQSNDDQKSQKCQNLQNQDQFIRNNDTSRPMVQEDVKTLNITSKNLIQKRRKTFTNNNILTSQQGTNTQIQEFQDNNLDIESQLTIEDKIKQNNNENNSFQVKEFLNILQNGPKNMKLEDKQQLKQNNQLSENKIILVSKSDEDLVNNNQYSNSSGQSINNENISSKKHFEVNQQNINDNNNYQKDKSNNDTSIENNKNFKEINNTETNQGFYNQENQNNMNKSQSKSQEILNNQTFLEKNDVEDAIIDGKNQNFKGQCIKSENSIKLNEKDVENIEIISDKNSQKSDNNSQYKKQNPVQVENDNNSEKSIGVMEENTKNSQNNIQITQNQLDLSQDKQAVQEINITQNQNNKEQFSDNKDKEVSQINIQIQQKSDQIVDSLFKKISGKQNSSHINLRKINPQNKLKSKNPSIDFNLNCKTPSTKRQGPSQKFSCDIESIDNITQENSQFVNQQKSQQQIEIKEKKTLQNIFATKQRKKSQFIILYDKKRKEKKKNTNIIQESENNQNNEKQQQQQQQEEKEEEEKIVLEKKYNIYQGIYLYHQFFGIYFTYDPTLSRPIRFSLYYLKILLLMMATGLFAQSSQSILTSFILTLIIAIFSGIPLAICKALITNEKMPVKIVGIIFSVLLYGTCFYAITIISILMREENAYAWQINYISSVLTDNAITQPLQVALKLKIFNIAIGTSLEPYLRSVFKHLGSFFAQNL